MTRSNWFSLLALFAVLLGAGGVVRSTAAQQPGDGEPDIAERFKPDRIAWQPCPENKALECGTLRLPVDYHKPRGDTFDMAVIRARATNPARRIGVLLGNPGGPGGSGVDAVLGGVGVGAPIITRLRERFDIVGFDPRGAHRSRPVRCNLNAGEPPAEAGDAAVAAFFDDLGRRYVEACRSQNGPFVFSLSMTNIARDMDALRRALGERQVSYLGISFGTQLGAVYASLFPQRLRATLLDAGIAPETHDGLVEFWSEYATAFEFAFQHLDRLCRGDSNCPLQETGLVPVFDQVIARLKQAPVTSPEGVELTDTAAINVVGEFLYTERTWPLIVQAIADAAASDYGLLFQLLDASPPGNSALIPILCNTYGTRRAAADLLPFDRAFTAANPRFFGRFTLLSTVSLCSAWPAAEETVIRNVRRDIATPMVLIGNDFDNATPLSWTRSLAFALGMERSVVRYKGGGHAVTTSGNRCTDDLIVAYLIERRVPAEGAGCPALPIAFEAAARATLTQVREPDQHAGWQIATPKPARNAP